jgi:hypothetical protein
MPNETLEKKPRGIGKGEKVFAHDPCNEFFADLGISLEGAIDLLREDALRGGVGAAAKFVRVWDALPANLRRATRLTLTCREAGVPGDEIRGGVLRIYRSLVRDHAEAAGLNKLMDVVDSFMETAQEDTSAAIRIMEHYGLLTPAKQGGISITQQTAVVNQPTERKGLPSVDDHMRLLNQPKAQNSTAPEYVDAEIVE